MGKSKRTCKEYARRIRHWTTYLLSEFSEYDLMKANECQFLSYKSSLLISGRQSNTINVKLNTISLFYDLAIKKGLITANPCPKGSLIYNKVEPLNEITSDEYLMIEGWIQRLPVKYRLPIRCILATGLRPGGIAKLTKSDIVSENGDVFIKSYNYDWDSVRWIPIMNRKTAALVYGLSMFSEQHLLFDVKKRELIKVFDQLKQIRSDFHHYLVRYSHIKRLERNNIPNHVIDYLFGEGPLPKQFKSISNDEHGNELMKHSDDLFKD
ncbi:hypothetical protein [Lactobacillus sp. Sy-1]|uniref:hypothetical protein n=1 Tax=Lactobacillus sp. Sy-1 TaxID=2109645 RepID=UPI001C5B42AA|nr:hypothetical protein [Lactobacillus sp. Sy-1]MBW1606444.1 hypothetical protein [Lactobacillus sp. Sy-1]